MFNRLHSRFKRAMIISVLFVLIIHLIAVICMYWYIIDRDDREKKEDIGTQISTYIAMRCQRIEENVNLYCSNGQIGDAVSKRAVNTSALMLNVMSIDESIRNYIIVSENYVYMYDSDSNDILKYYMDSGNSENDSLSPEWQLYDGNTHDALLGVPVLDSEGNKIGIMLIAVALDSFCNKMTENACVYMTDKEEHGVTICGELTLKDNKRGLYYIGDSFPFSDDITINVYFSRGSIYIKIIRLLLIMMAGYACLFIISICAINKYLRYIDNALSGLCIDMNVFIQKIDK